MNFTKEQIDYIKKAVDHVDFLTGGSRNSKTKQIIEKLQQENSQLKEKVNILNQYKLMCNAHFGTKVNPIQQTQRLKQLEYENSQLKERIEKTLEQIEKQKTKMYKNRNKIALFILMKIEEILKGGK